MKTLRSFFLLLGAVLLATLSAHATPYASGITNLSGNGAKGGTIQFILNEPADNVYVIFNDGSSNSIASPGVVGVKTFALGSKSSFAIYCAKNGSGLPSQISSDASSLNNFASPRGVGVDPIARDWHFGRIYVANASSAARGIFMRNADESDAVGQGTTGALTGGLPFVGSSYSPYRVAVGQDGLVYISSTSTVSGGGFLGVADPDIVNGTLAFPTPNTGYVAGENHTDVMGTARSFGSTNAGNLNIFAFDIYYPPGNSLLEWPVGSGPFPSIVTPNVAAEFNWGGIFIVSDDDVTSNYLYVLEDRASPTAPGNPCLNIYTNDVPSTYPEPTLWDSFDDSMLSGTDLFTNALGVAVSPDGLFLAEMNGNGAAYVVKLTNGIPDETSLTQLPGAAVGSSYGSVCFDSADNVYAVCSGVSILRAYSLGLSTITVSSNDYTGTNGTFSFRESNLPSVTVQATTNIASENYGAPVYGAFTLTRTGSTSQPLTVNYVLSGSGTNGTDYSIASTNSVTFAAGASTVTVSVTNIEPTNVSLPTLSLTMTLTGSTLYVLSLPNTAAVSLPNEGPQELVLSGVAAPTMYRGTSNDFVSFVVTRLGDTNVGGWTIPSSSFTLGGTAVFGTDYTGGPQPVSYTTAATPGPGQGIVVNVGDLTETFEVALPQLHTNYTGSESIVVNGKSGTSQEGTPFSFAAGSVTLTLLDNLNPPATVLWSDPLTNTNDSVNWTLTFQNSNTPPIVIPNYPNYSAGNQPAPGDYDVEFGYALANDTVGQSPAMAANGWTNALKMTVNKNPGGASAGANVYPQGKKFSGNYALRFSMNLTEGTFSTTEYNTFGINSYGTNCNWFASDLATGVGSTTTNMDGVWYGVDVDTDGNGVNNGIWLIVGQPIPNPGTASPTWVPNGQVDLLNFANVFKSPAAYNALPPGAPADGERTPANTWADVEIKQFNNIVTLSINKTVMLSYINTSIYTNGNIMLGYDDPYASIGSSAFPGFNPGAAVYYSNVRVVALSGPTTSKVAILGGNLVINFTSPDDLAATSSFSVVSSSSLTGPWTPTAATITQSGAVFSATLPYINSGSRFFLINQTDVVH
jgi:hypothetical protein